MYCCFHSVSNIEKDKRAILITGATGGIGSAILKELEGNDQTIFAHGNSQKETSSFSPRVIPLKADFANIADIDSMFTSLHKVTKKLSVFINTVGIEETAPDPLDTREWKRTFDVNLFGAVECTKRVLPLMEKDGGVIVHIASLAGTQGIVFRNSLAYSIAKAGLLKFTENLALMKAPKIRVFSVTPGYTITPIWNSFTNEEKHTCMKMVPIQRFIQPSEVAKFVVNLISNSAVTGGNYTIDGGLQLKECL